MKPDHNFKSHEMRMRAEWAKALCFAISECHPDDAKQIMAAALDDMAAGSPPKAFPFCDIRSDADWWADCAHPAELECYFSSALKRLGNRALGVKARKRLFVALWQSFPLADRQAFLSRVDADGRFCKGGA
ncbi:hypothetical protein [Roseinatronobacter bogoriensis]|nr:MULTISPECIES: hypothetical protein [Rhodobaca]